MTKFFTYSLFIVLFLIHVACGKSYSLTSPTSSNTTSATASTATATTGSPIPFPTLTPTPGVTSTPTLSFTPVTYPGLTYTDYSAPFNGNYFSSISVFKDELWVLPSNDSSIWSSPDGAAWTKVGNSSLMVGLTNYNTVTLNNKLYIIGGTTTPYSAPDVSAPSKTYCSSDGMNWSQSGDLGPIVYRQCESLIQYNNKIWLIGGWGWTNNSSGGQATQSNDIWNSSDGVSWNQSTSQAAFMARSESGVVVFNNKMWVIAGYYSNGINCPYLPPTQSFNDVWCSTDGANWTATTTNAPFSKRRGAFATVLNDQLWLVGGIDGNGYPCNDAWYSNDGVTWNTSTLSAGLTSVQKFSFLNKIWGIFINCSYAGNACYSEVFHD